MVGQVQAWRCSLCLVVLTLTLRHMLRHQYVAHSSQSNFHIECGINGCPETYTVFDSYRRHVHRRHAEYLDEMNSNSDHECNNNNDGDDVSVSDVNSPEYGRADDNLANEEEEPNILQDNPNDVVSVIPSNISTTSTNLILDLKFKHLLPQNIVDKVVSMTSKLIDLAQEHVLQTMEEKIKDATSLDNLTSNIQNIRQNLSVCPLKKVKTSYLQKKYIEKNFYFIEPRRIILGEKVTRKRKLGEYASTVKQDCFYYVPIIESIQQCLRNGKVSSCFNHCRKAASGKHFLQDVFNGTVYKEHSLSRVQNSIFISLYYDDFEVCNPLGTKSHKISMFYYSVLNYPLHYRSKLSSIKLLAVTYRHIVDEYGIDKILQQFVIELKSLYSGFAYEENGIESVVYAGLLNTVGDTPANNLLGGFKEGVGGAYMKCRHCYCDNEDMQTKFCEDDFIMRDLKSHISNCEDIEKSTTKQMKNYLSTLYGINRRSLLIDVPEFDICNNMPEDFMHIFLEGVAQYEIKEILKHFILEPNCYFSIHDLNGKLKAFNFGYDDLDKRPTPILLKTLHSNDNRIRQSASQMLVLLKIIPFILYDFIDSENVYIKFLLNLLDIYHILIAPLVTLGSLCHLKNLITDHLDQFKRIFPNLNIMPKQHYMLHFPMLIKKFGPAIRNWCMRFEAKHKQCKQIANKQNFANLPLSIAESIQYLESIDFQDDDFHPMCSNDMVIKSAKALTKDEEKTFIFKLKDFYSVDVTEITSVHKSNHVIIHGIHYISHQSFMLAECGDFLPCFGLIQNIYVINQNHYFFELQMYLTCCFNDSFKSYEIEIPDLAEAHIIKELEDNVDQNSYSSVSLNDKVFIPLKYAVDDLMDLYKTKN